MFFFSSNKNKEDTHTNQITTKTKTLKPNRFIYICRTANELKLNVNKMSKEYLYFLSVFLNGEAKKKKKKNKQTNLFPAIPYCTVFVVCLFVKILKYI